MAGVVGKISCSKVRDLLRFPDFDDSNYLEKKKKSVSFTLQRSQEMMNQPGDLALHQHQWATLIFSSNEGQSLHRRLGWDLKAPVLVVPRVALARLAMENEKKKKAISHQTQSAIRQEKAYAQRRSFINPRIRHRHHLLPDRPIQRKTFTWIKPICSHVDRNVHHRFVLVWFRAGWWGFL